MLPLRAEGEQLDPSRHGAKACGLQQLLQFGLAVPAGFVVPMAAAEEIAAGISADRATGVVTESVSALADAIDDLLATHDAASAPLAIRSGAAISLPGGFDTLLGVDRHDVAEAVASVVESTRGLRVETLVRSMGVDAVPPTAIVVQVEVDTTADSQSGAGVVMSRDLVTGLEGPTGSIAWRTRGDAVMAGQVPVESIDSVRARCPQVAAQLAADASRLDAELGAPVELEFAIEKGRLWYLQLRVLDDTTPTESRPTVTAPAGSGSLVARGRPASGGVATGQLCVDIDDALDLIDAGSPVILAIETSSPADVPVMVRAEGVLAVLGSPESHAAVVTRSAGVPAVVAVQGMSLGAGHVRFGDHAIDVGTTLSVDGTNGLVWTTD